MLTGPPRVVRRPTSCRRGLRRTAWALQFLRGRLTVCGKGLAASIVDSCGSHRGSHRGVTGGSTRVTLRSNTPLRALYGQPRTSNRTSRNEKVVGSIPTGGSTFGQAICRISTSRETSKSAPARLSPHYLGVLCAVLGVWRRPARPRRRQRPVPAPTRPRPTRDITGDRLSCLLDPRGPVGTLWTGQRDARGNRGCLPASPASSLRWERIARITDRKLAFRVTEVHHASPRSSGIRRRN